jgi:hypothetical protein
MFTAGLGVAALIGAFALVTFFVKGKSDDLPNDWP